MFLYSELITPRVEYMAHWLGNYFFGEPLIVYTNPNELQEGALIINYSGRPLLLPCYQIIPEGLLFETTVTKRNPSLSNPGKFPIFFSQASGHPFDILSAVFYLISRYEEYLPHQKDEYGRYAHSNSLAYKYDFLNRPLVDEWMEDLKEKLNQVFPRLPFIQRTFTYTPTYDVDIAWSYLNKGFIRTAGGFLKQLFSGKWQLANDRLRVLKGINADPFDVFEGLEGLHNKFHLHPVYFFLLAPKQKGYDKNISPYSMGYQQLIKNVAAKYKTGIHLSWQAHSDPASMKQEKKLLENNIAAVITANRMHYLKFDLPETFEQLETLGIKEDYSMGYGSINGFRASTCTPYLWYNLSKEATSALTVFPFAYMEANSIFEQKDDPKTALNELQHYHDVIKKVGGDFITIFHNHLMGNSIEGRKWWQVYELFLENNF
jgi:hypothetical protein